MNLSVTFPHLSVKTTQNLVMILNPGRMSAQPKKGILNEN